MIRIENVLRSVATLLACCAVLPASAGQPPYAATAPDFKISAQDRLYLSAQSSNAISVVDPSTNTLLGLIKLGGRLEETLAAVYLQQSLVHGMGFAPDHKTLAVVAVASNAVVFVDTATNDVKHVEYVGRAPHETMWTPDGREVWVAIRGQDYIQVLDGKTYKPTRRIQVPKGPGMIIFSPDGKYAYICSSFTPETVVIDTATYDTVGRIKQASSFCPNIAATPDGSQVWFTLKDSGRTQVISAQPPFKQIAVLETGPITNHVNFALTPRGQFAYVTIGGLRQVKVFTTGAQPKLVATINTGDNPHGLWPSGDGTRMYVGLQLGNAVAVIDTATNRVLNTIDVGAEAPMALMYVPRAVPADSTASKTANLVRPEEARKASSALHFNLGPSSSDSKSQSKQAVLTSVAVNSQGAYSDSLEAALSGLEPGKQYVLALADSKDGSGDTEPLASFKAGEDGAASIAVLGPFRSMLLGRNSGSGVGKLQVRYLTVAPLSGSGNTMKVGDPVQVQMASE